MKIGFIGLGTMGGEMAMQLAKAGHAMVVHDVRREAAARHLAEGGTWANDPGAVGAACEVVFTSLPGPAEVEAVALGDHGLLSGMAAGSTWFDLSTNSPTLIRRLHAKFEANDVAVLDAPVSGGPAGAAAGTLAIWVGGDEAEYERHKHLLDAMGDQPKYIGPIGAGAVAKLVHNCAGYTIQTALAEVFTMGVKAGVEPLELWDAIRHGAHGRARTFDSLGRQFLRGQFEPAAFALRLAFKDVTLATELGRDVGVPMRLANLAREELSEAVNRGWGDRDSRVAMLLQEERAGVQLAFDEAAIEAVRRRP
jgi:3-hydroxyisobutyrate dehydrogenase